MNRSVVSLLVVALVLLALVLLFASPFRDSIRADNPKPTSLFDAAQVNEADRIEIRSPGAPATVLSRGDQGWVVESKNGFPADTAAVGSILRAVAGAKSSGVASTNPENRGKFQVDSTGVQVKLEAGGKTVAEFTVGKTGRDFTTSYVLPRGSKEVYVVRALSRSLFQRYRGFRDPALFRFDPEDVVSVRLTAPDSSWVLARADTVWTLSVGDAKPVTAAQAKVDELLRSLSKLDADGFADGADTLDTGLDKPEYTLQLEFQSGEEAEIRIGAKNDRNQHYASRPDRPGVYLVSEWRVKRFAKKPGELTG